MIYTLTLNPSLDYLMETGRFTEGVVNRSLRERIVAGGKGINVSVMLKNLGVPSVALGFAAGFTGEELCRRIRALGVSEELIRLASGMTRINVKLKAETESEINGAGPAVPESALLALRERLRQLTKDDTLVLSGSMPPSVPRTLYAELAACAAERGVRLVADLSGVQLWDVAPYRPFLVKPNHHELSALFGVEIGTRERALEYACRLREKGPKNVLVSLAGDGAVLAAENGECYSVSSVRGTVVNSVGAGDSMVAGFLVGYDRGGYAEALRLGTAAGGATAFSDGIADGDLVEKLLSLTEY